MFTVQRVYDHIGAVASKSSGFDNVTDEDDWPWFEEDSWYDEESNGYCDWYPSEAEMWHVDDAP